MYFVERYMNGKKFKKNYDLKKLQFVKLVTHDGIHNDMVIKEGLNEDKNTFLPIGIGQPRRNINAFGISPASASRKHWLGSFHSLEWYH
jgi:hypothetical protein